MKFRCLLFATLLPFCALSQQLDVVRFLGQFSKGNEILAEYRGQFYDPMRAKRPTGPIIAASNPVPIGKGSMLIVWTEDQSYKPAKRTYFLSMYIMGTQGQCISFLTDSQDATFEKVADDALIFTTIESGKPKEKVLIVSGNRILNAETQVKFAEYTPLLNKVLSKSAYKLSDEDSQMMIKQKDWGAAKLKRLLAGNSITADEEKLLQVMVSNGPRFRGRLTETLLEMYITTKETEMNPEHLWTTLVKMESSTTDFDKCWVNIDGIPFAGGNIIGVTRSLVLDKGPKVTYSFAWFNGTQMGNVLFLDSDSRAAKQPDPTVTMIGDRFIKIVSHDGAGKPKVHYGAFSDYDLFLLADIPKDEMAFHRNYVFARYGYKFKNPVYQDHFSVYDWYKPEHEEAETVSKLMTADEREIVTQLAALEKTTK